MTPRKKILIPIAVFLVVAVVLTGYLVYRAHTRVIRLPQPIEFNHYKHYVEMELDCDTCHEYAYSNAVAGLPGYEVCGECHEEDPDHENPRFNEVARIVQYHAETNEPIRWVQMYKNPDHVVFSHERHLSAHVECSECHGRTGISKAPVAEIYRIAMENCMDCHEKRRVSRDCLTCHK